MGNAQGKNFFEGVGMLIPQACPIVNFNLKVLEGYGISLPEPINDLFGRKVSTKELLETMDSLFELWRRGQLKKDSLELSLVAVKACDLTQAKKFSALKQWSKKLPRWTDSNKFRLYFNQMLDELDVAKQPRLF